MLELFAEHPAQRVALVEGKRRVTYGELPGLVSSKIDVLRGYRCVALAQDNGIEWVLWDLAAAEADVALVPLPSFFTPAQTQHALAEAGCEALITDRISALSPEKVSLPPATAKVTFTSGTTGQPKGVCLSLSGMLRVAQSAVEVLGPNIGENHLCTLPLGVLLENVAGVYAALLAGCTIHVPSLASFGGNYTNLHAQMKASGATSLILVPETLRLLMQQVLNQGALPGLKFVAVGGSRVDPRVLSRARLIGLPVYEGYGLSECASVVALNTPAHDRRGTVGKLLSHIKLAIREGEIIVHNPAFLGYVGQPHSGHLATGDLGELDKDGYLKISGRKKNILITSYGRNVSPEWVEAALLAQPAIAQALVFGDAQPHLSALLVPARKDVDLQTAVASANAGLPDYAQVQGFEVVPPFTMQNGLLTGTGRPRRTEILQFYNH